MSVMTLAGLLDIADEIVNERLARLAVSVKTIGQVTKKYADELTNAVYDVWNGNSDPVDFRRAHKALIREYAPQAYEEGVREGGIDELDEDDKAVMNEAVSDWTSEQVKYVNDFAAAIAEARKDKDKRPAILDRIDMWVDSLRSLGDSGRAYAMSNVKATWQLGDRQNHTPDCVALSKRPAHRVSWWTERGYQPPIHLGCGCALVDAKSGETIMGE